MNLKKKNQKIFLTGATGKFGKELTQELIRANITFVAGLTCERPATNYLNSLVFNFANKDSLIKAFSGVDILFLLVPIADPMILFAQNALEAAKKCGVKHIVKLSAVGANPNSSYSILKIHGEIDQMIMDSKINYTIIRSSCIMQHFTAYNISNIKQGIFYSSTVDAKSAWIDAKDVSIFITSILQNLQKNKNKIFAVTGSEAISFIEIIRKISSVIPKKISLQNISQEVANAKMRDLGLSDFVVDILESTDQMRKDGATELTTNDFENELGYLPITFDDFIQKHTKFWK